MCLTKVLFRAAGLLSKEGASPRTVAENADGQDSKVPDIVGMVKRAIHLLPAVQKRQKLYG